MKKYLSVILIVVMIVTVCILLTACSNESKIIGNWICDEVHSGYPDSMTLNSDGTGIADGMSINWWVENDEFKFSYVFGSHSYDLTISGDTLFLNDYSYHKN